MKILLSYIVSNKFKKISEEESLRLIKIGLECEIRDIIAAQTEDISSEKIPSGLNSRRTVYTT